MGVDADPISPHLVEGKAVSGSSSGIDAKRTGAGAVPVVKRAGQPCVPRLRRRPASLLVMGQRAQAVVPDDCTNADASGDRGVCVTHRT